MFPFTFESINDLYERKIKEKQRHFEKTNELLIAKINEGVINATKSEDFKLRQDDADGPEYFLINISLYKVYPDVIFETENVEHVLKKEIENSNGTIQTTYSFNISKKIYVISIYFYNPNTL